MNIQDNVRKGFIDRLLTWFPAEYGSSLPVGLPNHAFEQPKNQPYLLPSFRFFKAKRAATGTTRVFNRYPAVLLVDCVVPKDTGTATAYRMADSIVTVFDAETFPLDGNEYVTCQTPYVAGEGKLENGAYYVTVLIPFHVDACAGG